MKTKLNRLIKQQSNSLSFVLEKCTPKSHMEPKEFALYTKHSAPHIPKSMKPHAC